MILVDTSVWIDFFDHPESPYAKKLQALIEKDDDLCLADINLTEILQGIKEDKIFEEVRGYLKQFPILRTKSLETCVQAAEIYRSCRRKGRPITKTIDALIAAVAIENNFHLFHRDKDFNAIAECTKLKIYGFP